MIGVNPSNHASFATCCVHVYCTSYAPVQGFDISHVLKKSLHLDACYIHDISESKYGKLHIVHVYV